MGELLVLALPLLAAVGIAIWLVRESARRPVTVPAKEPPMEAVRRRYAAGEISPEHFEEIRQLLDG